MPDATRSGPNIEIVHLAFAPFPADIRVKREALAAAETGRTVAVVALRGPGEPAETDVGPLRVFRLPGTKSRGGPLRYLFEYLTFVRRSRRLLAQDPRFRFARIVHVHTLPDFLVWAATPARRRGARLILDLHEIFPEFARAKYSGVLGRAAGRIAEVLERQARRRADVTITVNRPIAELLASRGIGRPERIVLVHNSADPRELGPLRQPDGRWSPREPLELIYHGTLTRMYGLDVAIRGVARAAAGPMCVPVHFTILGDGPERASLVRLVADLDATRMVTFEAPLHASALPDRLSRAHGGVVPTRLDGMTRYSLSNKLLEYVHLGIPLLAARLPSYAEYLGDDAAWFWIPDDPDSLAAAIQGFAAAPPDAWRVRASRAQEVLQGISWDVERARLIATYHNLLDAP
jgi:glycosyltransferase involved in cell wall biosynthesis